MCNYLESRTPPQTILRMELEYTWQLARNIVITVTHGDIFQVSTNALVNSEQTDSELDYNPSSISGRIRHSTAMD